MCNSSYVQGQHCNLKLWPNSIRSWVQQPSSKDTGEWMSVVPFTSHEFDKSRMSETSITMLRGHWATQKAGSCGRPSAGVYVVTSFNIFILTEQAHSSRRRQRRRCGTWNARRMSCQESHHVHVSGHNCRGGPHLLQAIQEQRFRDRILIPRRLVLHRGYRPSRRRRLLLVDG